MRKAFGIALILVGLALCGWAYGDHHVYAAGDVGRIQDFYSAQNDQATVEIDRDRLRLDIQNDDAQSKAADEAKLARDQSVADMSSSQQAAAVPENTNQEWAKVLAGAVLAVGGALLAFLSRT
jgi:hypothetical protein